MKHVKIIFHDMGCISSSANLLGPNRKKVPSSVICFYACQSASCNHLLTQQKHCILPQHFRENKLCCAEMHLAAKTSRKVYKLSILKHFRPHLLQSKGHMYQWQQNILYLLRWQILRRQFRVLSILKFKLC